MLLSSQAEISDIVGDVDPLHCHFLGYIRVILSDGKHETFVCHQHFGLGIKTSVAQDEEKLQSGRWKEKLRKNYDHNC